MVGTEPSRLSSFARPWGLLRRPFHQSRTTLYPFVLVSKVLPFLRVRALARTSLSFECLYSRTSFGTYNHSPNTRNFREEMSSLPSTFSTYFAVRDMYDTGLDTLDAQNVTQIREVFGEAKENALLSSLNFTCRQIRPTTAIITSRKNFRPFRTHLLDRIQCMV